ncbi:MAG: DMT family transporter [Oscillospiraceae bacterium]|nr:DMT family transporter [Oscillospiraceae bacterium]
MSFLYNNWYVCIVMYLVCGAVWTQVYNKIAKNTADDEAATILFEMFSGVAALALAWTLPMKWPTDPKIWVITVVVTFFYALVDRYNTKALMGIQPSVFSIMNQITTAFMTLAGFVIFKEEFIWGKLLGAVLILAANVFMFYEKGTFTYNKYVGYGLVSAVMVTIATFIDVSISDAFNLFIYIAICIGGTGVINSALSRIKLSRLKAEVKNTGWVLLAINGTCLSAMVMFMLRAYHLGDASATAPLLASSVVVNVIVSFFVAKERDNIPKKILCACVILASVVMITFAK